MKAGVQTLSCDRTCSSKRTHREHEGCSQTIPAIRIAEQEGSKWRASRTCGCREGLQPGWRRHLAEGAVFPFILLTK